MRPLTMNGSKLCGTCVVTVSRGVGTDYAQRLICFDFYEHALYYYIPACCVQWCFFYKPPSVPVHVDCHLLWIHSSSNNSAYSVNVTIFAGTEQFLFEISSLGRHLCDCPLKLLVSCDVGGAITITHAQMDRESCVGLPSMATTSITCLKPPNIMLATCNIQINTVQEVPAFLCSESVSASV